MLRICLAPLDHPRAVGLPDGVRPRAVDAHGLADLATADGPLLVLRVHDLRDETVAGQEILLVLLPRAALGEVEDMQALQQVIYDRGALFVQSDALLGG